MKRRCAAFTLVELLAVMAVVAVLTALLLPVVASMRRASSGVIAAHTLHVLGVAGNLYLSDHDQVFWPFREFPPDGGTQWWFGWESDASTAEGQRVLDTTRGPLGPYAIAAGGVKTDPAFLAYSPRLKPKYRDGNYGYGYNRLLQGKKTTQYAAGQTVVFATCAQVNTFQAPASSTHPMIEEFYWIDDQETTVHFRHDGKALAAFLDGSVRDMEMAPGTLDTRMPSANIGRFAPVGSKQWLGD